MNKTNKNGVGFQLVREIHLDFDSIYNGCVALRLEW
jgi:hypothetical protein